MNRQSFVEEVERRIMQIFSAQESGMVPPVEQTSELQGFVQAGTFLGLVKLDEMHELMEAVHVSMFGKTIEERKLEQPGSWSARSIDYSIYDAPTYARSGDLAQVRDQED